MPYCKGDVIEGYKVSLLLKESGGVETYRVRDTQGRLCVLKMGITEAEHLYAPKSGLFMTASDNYAVYRYVNGETLESRLLRLRKLGEEEAEALARGILDQLGAMHRNGMAHTNLTPDNIVVEWSGETLTPHIVGLGRVKPMEEGDAAKDLCAVGAIVCRMLTGEGPDMLKVLAGKPTPIHSVMMKALDEGFGTAGEMLDALDGKVRVEVHTKPKGPGFAAVAGMEALKEQLRTEVIEILAERERAAQYGIEIPNGMLLYGPPGCGKTYLAARFAEEAGYNYKCVKSSDLASTYLHGTQEKIAALFDEARHNAPTILCFDEFDAFVPRRDDVNNASQSGEVNEFLSQMDNCGKSGVFVIATTNRPDRIDPAVLRSGRMDSRIFVPVPDSEARKELFRVSLTGRPVGGDVDYVRLAAMTEGFVASDIASVVQVASREAFRQKTEITQALLKKAAASSLPSLSKSQLKEYAKMRDVFAGLDSGNARRGIGFK